MSGIVGSKLNIRGSGRIAKLGTDGQVLTSAGAGLQANYEDAAGGGDLIRLNTDTTNTGAAAYNFDTFVNATYKDYLVILDLYTSSSGGVGKYIRMRNASGDLTGSNYYGCHYGRSFDSGSDGAKDEKVWGGTTGATFSWSVADSAANLVDYPCLTVIRFSNITSDGMPTYQWQSQGWDGTADKRDVTGSGIYLAKEDIRGFTIYESGTFRIGTVTTYGIKNS